MASPTWWTWVCVSSRSWWWTGKPGVLQSMGSQRVGHDWATELNWTENLDCSAEDPGSIPGWGRSAGERIGCLLQYFQVSLVAQLVKNSPTMQETWVQSLGWGDPLEKGKATHCSILAWRIPETIQSLGSQRIGHNWETVTSLEKRQQSKFKQSVVRTGKDDS